MQLATANRLQLSPEYSYLPMFLAADGKSFDCAETVTLTEFGRSFRLNRVQPPGPELTYPEGRFCNRQLGLSIMATGADSCTVGGLSARVPYGLRGLGAGLWSMESLSPMPFDAVLSTDDGDGSLIYTAPRTGPLVFEREG